MFWHFKDLCNTLCTGIGTHVTDAAEAKNYFSHGYYFKVFMVLVKYSCSFPFGWNIHLFIVSHQLLSADVFTLFLPLCLCSLKKR